MRVFCIVFFICVFINTNIHAQFSDDFSDANFSTNPQWKGDTALFTVNSNLNLQTQSNNQADTNQLCTISNLKNLDGFEWNFWIKLSFNTSSNNNLRIYLTSNTANLKGTLDGYFVQIGGTADSVWFCRQEGNSMKKIIFTKISTNKTKNSIRFKITRDKNAKWELYADTDGANNLILRGSTIDSTFKNSDYFGLFCKYTKSNSAKFYFDDFVVKKIPIDTCPPKVTNIKVQTNNSILIEFDEQLDSITASNKKNYNVNNNLLKTQKVTLQNGKKEVIMELANNLVNATKNTLYIKNIKDLKGNTLKQDSIKFIYFIPQKNDIIINEFLADPTPSIGLPESEFVELYNKTNFKVDINNWKLHDNMPSHQVKVQNCKISPNSFLILCNEDDTNLFKPFGTVCGVNNLFALNNSSDHIVIIDEKGNTINHIFYNLDLVEGGKTAELVNPNHPCSKNTNNWKISNHQNGGTPGKINSVFSTLLDTTKPYIKNVMPLDSINLVCELNIEIDTNTLTAQNINFSCNNYVKQINFDSKNNKIFRLKLQNELIKNQLCKMTVQNIRDCIGNQTKIQTVDFIYFVTQEAERGDIVINEIFADPNPKVALPEYEFVEIYNRSGKYISLENWNLADASAQYKIPKIIINPNEYLIMCNDNNIKFFEPYGKTVGLTTFPSLGNSGDELFLSDDKGRNVHYVPYKDTWYKNEIKKKGGWTLEAVNYDNYCEGINNWIASKDKKGGTPGKVNSVYENIKDVKNPEIWKVIALDSTSITVFFTENLSPQSIADLNNYTVDNNIGKPISCIIDTPKYNKIILKFNSALKKRNLYKLSIQQLEDCAKNQINSESYMEFGLAEYPDSADIVINELLFNPYIGGADFVELYNRTDKFLYINQLYFAKFDTDNKITNPEKIHDSLLVLFPKTYMVFSQDPQDIKDNYSVKFPENLVKTDLPTMSDDEGSIVLLNRFSNQIDYFKYSEDIHFPLISNKDGVSLERLDYDKPASFVSNWQSAASVENFATPTYKNSHFNRSEGIVKEVKIEPKIFSPDNDGYQDFVTIRCKTNSSISLGTISIYNLKGVLVRAITNNELLGNENEIKWDGTGENGVKLQQGIYIILIQTNDTEGNSSTHKETCTLIYRNRKF